MELEGNQKPRNASIAAQTILRIFFAAEGGGYLKLELEVKCLCNIVHISHTWE